ncbi:MAG: hypothetical protein KatS3mg060_1110 [Dehalococcoidia bacterium]|nr:MAG: hypothetical protein KatS3mg060_1110 [Dehalococcoidia bacterium]
MNEWTALADGIRSGTVSAETVSDWLCAQPVLWFVAEGERDEHGRPMNARPIVMHHPSGATISVMFTEESRAHRYCASRDDLPEDHLVVAAAPADGFAALLALPIDGVTINPGDPDRLNAGRRQLEVLAQRSGRHPHQ